MKTSKRSSINLLPKEDFEKTITGRFMKWILTTFRLIVIVVQLIVIAGFLSRFWLDIQVSNLDNEITQKSAVISSKSQFEKEFRLIQKKLEIYKSIATENKILATFQKVSDNLPVDTQLISFTKESNTLHISGTSLSENSIARFISLLEKEQEFELIDLREISADVKSPFIKFNVNAVLAKKGEQDGN